MMNEEVKRFFDAIEFSTDSFKDTLVKKVVLNKRSDSFSVFLNNEKVLEKDDVDSLMSCSKKGIQNKKCKVKIVYKEITFYDIKKYLDIYFKDLIKTRPSYSPLKEYEFSIDENVININLNISLMKKEVEQLSNQIKKYLKKYFLGEYDINLITYKNGKTLKEGIKETNVGVLENSDTKLVMGEFVNGKITDISNIYGEEKNVAIEAYVFQKDVIERVGKKATAYIMELKVNDFTDSFYLKMVKFNEEEFNSIAKHVKENEWYKFGGRVELDNYKKQLLLNVSYIEKIDSKFEEVKDLEKDKRVELHAHSTMSAMDGVIDPKKLIDFAHKLGHKGVAITDHNVVQAFPTIYNASRNLDDFKVLYGAEINVVNTESKIVYNKNNYVFKDTEFIVFDLETTGFYPYNDQIIEIGAVKVKNNKVISRFSELIKNEIPLPKIITDLTGIKESDLKDKDSEENVLKRFLEYIGDTPLVAHNASFDKSFIDAGINKYKLNELKNTVIDTMTMARVMYPDWSNHKLSTLVKNLDVEWDESKHHRADYDSEGTSSCFYKMIQKLEEDNILDIEGLDKLVDYDNLVKFAYPFHVTLLAKNQTGLKNLFKITSIVNTKYLYKGREPRIPKEELLKLSDGILIGSGCINGEVFEQGFKLSDTELEEMMSFYDYIEVYPSNVVTHLIGKEQLFNTLEDYQGYVKRLIKIAKKAKKLVVATGDVHNLLKEDLIYRKIIVNQKFGGKLHPLNRRNLEIPNQYFLTTDEMLKDFSYLDELLRKEIVVTNTNKIFEMVDKLEIIKKDLYTPKMKDSAKITKDMVYEKAYELYGKPLPEIVNDRLEAELAGIISGGYDVIYLISEKLVTKSNADGYFVGSRGSVGSSLVATMMGITEVNGLPPHYLCPSCKHSIFEVDGVTLASQYTSGYDMPDMKCKCGSFMQKEGQDMPFATFLGFKAEKVPDIDLNFSGDYQSTAHEQVRDLFGETNVFRAGTISTVASRTAYGFVKGYCEDKGVILNPAEIDRLAKGCEGVKRTTGQHPGGIIVIPSEMDVFDFTPYQYPADEPDSSWYTTHFDFHAIDNNVLKLDLLGHDDPTMLKYLGDTTGVNILDINFDDKDVLSLFSSCQNLKINSDDIMCSTGTLGIPEFGTNFVIRMLEEVKPKKFADLVKISGLSHGTNVWQNNVRDVITNDIASFDEVVGCRDDIMVSLINYGMKDEDAFKISEFVRKGRAKKEPDKWVGFASEMRANKVPEWFIETCRKIEYMFPKAHACAYVMMAFRVAWFKLNYPLHYYSAYFSIRRSDFDVASMLRGYDGIRQKIAELRERGYQITDKEKAVADTLNVALEMLARGYSFSNIDVVKSEAKTFVINESDKTLTIPFMALEGLGETAANTIVEERAKKEYHSIEDFQMRGKVNQTTMGRLRDLNVFEGMSESSQMSLF